jgi:hypothetical protein
MVGAAIAIPVAARKLRRDIPCFDGGVICIQLDEIRQRLPEKKLGQGETKREWTLIDANFQIQEPTKVRQKVGGENIRTRFERRSLRGDHLLPPVFVEERHRNVCAPCENLDICRLWVADQAYAGSVFGGADFDIRRAL